MKKHIVCLGDSNTYGYCADPSDTTDGAGKRFNEQERWPCLLQQGLGQNYLVLEEGLPGRTTVFRDPLHEGLSALDYLCPCLETHKPVSLLIVMLGTNDTKERFSADSPCIAAGLERLLRKAQTIDCWETPDQPNILVIAPVPIGPELENLNLRGDMGRGFCAKSRELPELFQQVAQRLGAHYLDASQVGAEYNRVDYMHLTKKAHHTLANALIQRIPLIVP